MFQKIEKIDSPADRKSHAMLIIVVIFIVIFLLLVITSFSGSPPFTGSAVGPSQDQNNQDQIIISADLSIPDLIIEDTFKALEIKTGPSPDIFIGEQKLSFPNSNENTIELSNYEGNIVLKDSEIQEIVGKAAKVVVNGNPITSQTGSPLQVQFTKETNFKSLKLNTPISLKKLDYTTTGTITLEKEKTILKADNDNLIIKKFEGTLEINSGRFIINGYSESLNLKGDKEISIN
jgi:hypothetical protein